MPPIGRHPHRYRADKPDADVSKEITDLQSELFFEMLDLTADKSNTPQERSFSMGKVLEWLGHESSRTPTQKIEYRLPDERGNVYNQVWVEPIGKSDSVLKSQILTKPRTADGKPVIKGRVEIRARTRDQRVELRELDVDPDFRLLALRQNLEDIAETLGMIASSAATEERPGSVSLSSIERESAQTQELTTTREETQPLQSQPPAQLPHQQPPHEPEAGGWPSSS
jgi:hypothetical protein